MAKKKTCPNLKLRKPIEKALNEYHALEQQTQDALTAADIGNDVRSAFVVFQRTQFADDVINRAPKGAPSLLFCHTCMQEQCTA